MAKNLKHIFIMTGASRGLGRALAEKLAGPDSVLFLISRGDMKPALKEFKNRGCQAHAFRFDLAKANQLEALVTKIFKTIDMKSARSITLINNAGMITPVGLAGNVDMGEAIKNLEVNAVAPIVLSHGFIRMIRRFKGRKLIVNISTGAARRPIEGWSLYCSAKAALEMFTQCAAKEQELAGVRVVSVDPGALDTDMQREIRRQSKKDFPLVGKFIEWHQTGILKSPQTAAEEIINTIKSNLGAA
jgi:benzil reductase ((S)-benzoin forming)